MLALDIETENLLPSSHDSSSTPLPKITCACLYDGQNSYKLQLQDLTEAEKIKNIKTLLELLDTAETLCGYNAVLFDLEFIRRSFHIDDKRFSGWICKCIDPFMYAKYLPGIPCKLQYLLELNHLESKTGSGADAILLAKNQEWDKLLDYCLMDAKLTFNLCSLPWIKLSPILLCSSSLITATKPPIFRLLLLGCDEKSISHTPPQLRVNEFPSILLNGDIFNGDQYSIVDNDYPE